MPTESPPTYPRWVRKLLIALVVIAIVGFTVWIIREANIGRDNALFKLVRRTPYGDKIGHFFLAGLFTLAVNHILQRWPIRLGRIRLPSGSVIVTFLVILEEGSQHYLPTRSFDWRDALANFAGILVFSLPHYRRAQRKKSERSSN